jgi:WD40 repeat protein
MLTAAAWSRAGDLVAAVARDGTFWVWDATRRTIVVQRYLDARLERAIDSRGSSRGSLVPKSALPMGGGRPQVAFSPDGSRLATLDSSGAIRLWSTSNWASAIALPDVAGSTTSMFFAPDGMVMAVTSQGQARLYDVATATLLRTVRAADETAVACGSFSPDGKTIALGTINGNVKCYDHVTGRLTTTLVGHLDRVSSICYSPDGRNLATGSWDTTVRLWDVASGREVAVLERHGGRVHAVLFSPDGAVLASGGEIDPTRGEVFLWRAERKPLARFDREERAEP